MMKKQYVRKLGASVFLVSVLILSSIGVQSAAVVKKNSLTVDGTTLYVGGSGPGNYSTIQSALDDAVDNDTVFVYSGEYYESFYINNSIDLIGQSSLTTKIIGCNRSSTITCFAPDISVNNFFITNGTAGITFCSKNCKISENVISGNYYAGIYMEVGFNIYIRDNIISDNTYDGIYIKNPSYCVHIIDNSIENNGGRGIGLSLTGGIQLTRNNISNNDVGVETYRSSNVDIVDSEISENQIGIYNKESDTNSQRNNLIDNGVNGLIEKRFYDLFKRSRNTWNENYWSDYNGLGSKKIRGRIVLLGFIAFPWIEFDKNPAENPFDM